MKKFNVILIAVLTSVILLGMFSAAWSSKAGKYGKYNVVFRQEEALPGKDGKVMIVGYNAKNITGTNPASLLVIYKITSGGEKAIYNFSPVVPEAVGYPRPLMIEKAQVVRTAPSEMFIVTSWGETGADYFGTHPVVFSYNKGVFKAVPFYKGSLSEDKTIKRFSWTRKDFTVSNYYNKAEKVQTILTQGVSATSDGKVELNFYGDNKPHADNHKIIKLIFPLIRS
ncbi:MAG: hypothetical protein M1269_12035 [Chloroflexi bacterium]|nr:hypothetical protein [Chloroflexota bacterium]